MDKAINSLIAVVVIAITIGFGMMVWEACEPTPVRGVVVKKQHRSQWIQVSNIMVGKVIVPQTIVHPEQWDLVVQNDGTTGETGQFLVITSRAEWEQIMVGDVWQKADTSR